MPIYEYKCTKNGCGHELEALQKISDDPLVYCPSCGEASLKKKISAAGFRLKGTGWYETDFKNGGKKSTPAKDATTETKKGESSAKSDSPAKPAGGGSNAAA